MRCLSNPQNINGIAFEDNSIAFGIYCAGILLFIGHAVDLSFIKPVRWKLENLATSTPGKIRVQIKAPFIGHTK